MHGEARNDDSSRCSSPDEPSSCDSVSTITTSPFPSWRGWRNPFICRAWGYYHVHLDFLKTAVTPDDSIAQRIWRVEPMNAFRRAHEVVVSLNSIKDHPSLDRRVLIGWWVLRIVFSSLCIMNVVTLNVGDVALLETSVHYHVSRQWTDALYLQSISIFSTSHKQQRVSNK